MKITLDFLKEKNVRGENVCGELINYFIEHGLEGIDALEFIGKIRNKNFDWAVDILEILLTVKNQRCWAIYNSKLVLPLLVRYNYNIGDHVQSLIDETEKRLENPTQENIDIHNVIYLSFVLEARAIYRAAAATKAVSNAIRCAITGETDYASNSAYCAAAAYNDSDEIKQKIIDKAIELLKKQEETLC